MNKMDRWMDGWTDGCIDAWIDGWLVVAGRDDLYEVN